MIESLKEALTAFTAAATALREAKNLLPQGKGKQDVEKAIGNAEETLKIAEAKIAKEFDYAICQRHFPPGIMLMGEGGIKCRDCDHFISLKAKGGFAY